MNIIKNEFEVIIRKNSRIKSRQWWINCIKKLNLLLLKHLPKEKKTLTKQAIFTLLITNNTEIKKLNSKYRKSNKATDVLSFGLNKKEQAKNKYLGDIVISSQKAKEQAEEKYFSTDNELIMLLVHGYLHLLGYDHENKREAKVMFSLQNKLLLEMLFY